MYRKPVNSSNIASIGFDNGTLEIAFKKGGLYQYFNVPEHVNRALMSAPSKGRFFHHQIEGRFQTKKLK